MKPMTSALRKKITKYIKNGLDISDLIDGYCIRNENLSGAIISRFKRANDNISNVNLSKAKLGVKGKITNISGCNMRDSNWTDCEFYGIVYARRVDARNANFSGAILTNVEYQYGDFRGAKFCETCMRVGSSYGMGARMDQTFFADLTKGWNLKVVVKTEEEMLNEQKQYPKY